MDRNRFEAIIFDLGNTLVYFDTDWEAVGIQAGREMVREFHERGLGNLGDGFVFAFLNRLEEYYIQRDSDFIEYTTLNVLQNLLEDWGYPDIKEPELRLALQAFYKVTQDHWILEDDAVEVLEELHSRNFKLGIISNAGDDADVQAIVENVGIRNYFDIVQSSAAFGIRKPDPRIFMHVLDRWKIHPKKVVMVGDTLGADIVGANNVGIVSVWITRRVDFTVDQDEEASTMPNAKIDNLKILPKLLHTL